MSREKKNVKAFTPEDATSPLCGHAQPHFGFGLCRSCVQHVHTLLHSQRKRDSIVTGKQGIPDFRALTRAPDSGFVQLCLLDTEAPLPHENLPFIGSVAWCQDWQEFRATALRFRGAYFPVSGFQFTDAARENLVALTKFLFRPSCIEGSEGILVAYPYYRSLRREEKDGGLSLSWKVQKVKDGTLVGLAGSIRTTFWGIRLAMSRWTPSPEPKKTPVAAPEPEPVPEPSPEPVAAPEPVPAPANENPSEYEVKPDEFVKVMGDIAKRERELQDEQWAINERLSRLDRTKALAQRAGEILSKLPEEKAVAWMARLVRAEILRIVEE